MLQSKLKKLFYSASAIALLCFSMSSTALAFDKDEKEKPSSHTSRPPMVKADTDPIGAAGSTTTAAAGVAAKAPKDSPKPSASATTSGGGSGAHPALPPPGAAAAIGGAEPEEELREQQEAIARFARANNSPHEAFLLAFATYMRKVKRDKDGNPPHQVLLDDPALYKEMYPLLHTASKAGHVGAIYNLAYLIEGNKIHQDENEAPIQDDKHRFQVISRLYRKTHKAGLPLATFNLFNLIKNFKVHEDEDGVPIKDHKHRSEVVDKLSHIYYTSNRSQVKLDTVAASLIADNVPAAAHKPPVDSAAGEVPSAVAASANAAAPSPLGTGSGASSGAKSTKD